MDLPEGLLVPHLLLHVLFDVPQIVFLLHLKREKVEIGLCLALAILKFKTLNIRFFLALLEGALPVQRLVRLLYPLLLLVLLELASV